MTRTKLKICICLLLFSLLLSIGTVFILRNSRNGGTEETPGPSKESTQGVVVPTTTVEQPTPTTQETTEATTEPTTQPTTEAATVPETTEQTVSDIGVLVAQVAADQVGKPYEYGAAGPDSFDTSGLVQYCYKQCGISVPRSNSALAEHGYVVDKKDILPGDAVFFWSSTPGTAEYLGIYIGNGMIVAALNSSKPVVEFDMNSSYYTEHFVYVRRFY